MSAVHICCTCMSAAHHQHLWHVLCGFKEQKRVRHNKLLKLLTALRSPYPWPPEPWICLLGDKDDSVCIWTGCAALHKLLIMMIMMSMMTGCSRQDVSYSHDQPEMYNRMFPHLWLRGALYSIAIAAHSWKLEPSHVDIRSSST